MTNSVTLPHPGHGAVSQGTVIEGNRVAAEVYAAILVAQQVPRDLEAVQAEMEQLCRMPSMARKAMYKFPKGGKTVTGPTIQLMKELVRIWRNTQWGMVELSRTEGKSELLAYAWDAQTNSRSSRIVIVEHKRDKSGENPEDLIDMREIMTNNTNIASRHLRETIATILPLWFVDKAVELCLATMTGGGSVPIPQKIRNCVVRFEELGIRKDRLVARLGGRPTNEWDALDLADLLAAYSRVQSGEVTADDEFPPPVIAVQVAELTAPAVTSDDDTTGDASDVTELPEIPQDLPSLLQLMYDLFLAGGIGATAPVERAKRLRIITRVLGLPDPVTAVTDLTAEQVTEVVTFMAQHRGEGDLMATLAEYAEATD